MLTIGVTGGIGSGKTTVCRALEQCGASVFYADLEARSLMQDDPSLRARLRERFGPETYSDDGRLNRSYLASRVFSDQVELDALNALVHPAVGKAFDAFRARSGSSPLVVKEAALLLETRRPGELAAVVVVSAPIGIRLERVRERDGAGEQEVRARMRRQLPQEVMQRHANVLIDNDGDVPALLEQVRILWDSLSAQA